MKSSIRNKNLAFIEKTLGCGIKSSGCSGLVILATVMATAAFPASVSAKVVEAVDTLTLDRAFTELPVRALDLLTRSSRLDMLDYLRADSLVTVTNTMGGQSKIIEAGKEYIKVSMTPVSTLELLLLPYRDPKSPKIAMTIYTVGGEGAVPDSDIAFYDSDMRPVARERFFKQPDLKEFFSIPKGSQTSMKEIEEMIPFPAASYTLTPSSESSAKESGFSSCTSPYTLSGSLSVSNLLPEEEKHLVDLFLRPSISWTWDGRRWKPANR